MFFIDLWREVIVCFVDILVERLTITFLIFLVLIILAIMLPVLRLALEQLSNIRKSTIEQSPYIWKYCSYQFFFIFYMEYYTSIQ